HRRPAVTLKHPRPVQWLTNLRKSALICGSISSFFTIRRMTMSITRRQFVQGGVAAWLTARFATAADSPPAKIRVGAREASYGGKLESAGRCDLDGVELGCGPAAERLKIADPILRKQYRDQCKSLGLVVSSLSMDLLNDNPL